VSSWPGEGSWIAVLPLSSRPVDLGSEVVNTEIKSQVMSVTAEHPNETSVDYPSLSLPTLISQ